MEMVSATGGIKVVMVDDDVFLTRTVGMLLRKKGYIVNVFDKGVDAVKYFFDELPDVVILNSRLPDCNGCFIAGLLEKMDKTEKLLIIFLSVMETDRDKISKTGKAVFLQKPFDMGKLIDVIERNTHNSSLAISS
jgi:two-component system KDP operon response regulator KdpE